MAYKLKKTLYLWRSVHEVEEDRVQERQLPAKVNVTIVLKKLVPTFFTLQNMATTQFNDVRKHNNLNFSKHGKTIVEFSFFPQSLTS